MQSQSPDGEMVDALVSGASAERRVGSSPILGTSKGVFFGRLLFRLPGIELGQLVAMWRYRPHLPHNPYKPHNFYLIYPFPRKIVNDEIIFVQGKATKAEHSEPM